MKKSKKNLKGMTLIEIIVSLAILAIMSAVLLTIGQVVDATTRSSTNLKAKVNAEAPYAAHRVNHYDSESNPGTTVPLPTTNIQVQVQLQCPAGQYHDVDSGQTTTFPANPGVTVNGYRCNTEDYYKSLLTPDQQAAYPNQANSNLNLEYVFISPTTAPST